MKGKSTVLLAAMLLGCAGSAGAAQSLEQIRYALYKDPNADVVADLRALAERGDLASRLLLGDRLAAGDAANGEEALALYKEAFADGRGEVLALSSMSRLLERNPRMRKANADYVREALGRFPHTRDPRTLDAALEVFLVFPEYFQEVRVAELIGLYESSCLEFCRPQLYKAVFAERQGRREEAERWYREAVFVDTRAVVRYYDFLGSERQDTAFPAFARTLFDQKDRLPVEAVHRIGTLLDSIYSTQSGLIAIENRALREADAGLEGEAKAQADAAETAREEAQARQLAETNAEVRAWLDNAIERNWVPAMVSKVNNMTSSPQDFTSDEALALVERVAQTDPLRAKALMASVLMVTNWLTLDPEKAHALIQELIAANYQEAQLLLGDLYSRGGLDEPDLDKALAIFHEQALKGSPSAYYRIASLYNFGRAICHDKAKAHAYAEAARGLGEFRANGLLKRLEKEMSSEELQRALVARDEIYKEYRL
ncbi:SEL1-like repeat protein [Pseudomonas sp. A46]|nr:hypothetical protein [Pseudomonas sp. A46]OWJ95979.1 hypothetical protein B6S59_08615 [Pseudomonas sp. A46]